MTPESRERALELLRLVEGSLLMALDAIPLSRQRISGRPLHEALHEAIELVAGVRREEPSLAQRTWKTWCQLGECLRKAGLDEIGKI